MKKESKILIFGGGFVGTAAKAFFGDRAVISPIETTEFGALYDEIAGHRPQIVINAAGETDTHGLEKGIEVARAYKANVLLPVMLAQACDKLAESEKNPRDITFVTFSTGMMFHDPAGNRFASEDGRFEGDPPMKMKQTVYARQKMAAEIQLVEGNFLMSNRPKKTIILRIHQPMSHVSHRRNFLTRMGEFPAYLDEDCSMICLEDCLGLIEPLIVLEKYGIIHAANPGLISPLKIATMMKEVGLIDQEREIVPYTRQQLDFDTKKKRGAFQSRVLLKNSTLITSQIQMRPIEEAVQDTLMKMVALRATAA